MKTGPYKIAESILGHPMRPREMTLVHDFGARTIALRVDAKDDLSHFLPAGAFVFRIEQAEVGREMCAIIVGQPRVRRRSVKKTGFSAHS